jgi:hypothetical protein
VVTRPQVGPLALVDVQHPAAQAGLVVDLLQHRVDDELVRAGIQSRTRPGTGAEQHGRPFRPGIEQEVHGYS